MNGRSQHSNHDSGHEDLAVGRASDWLVLLESGDSCEEYRARFEEWLAADSKHRSSYASLSETWSRLTVMRERAQATVGVDAGSAAMLQHHERVGRSFERRHRPAWTAAAALLGVAAVSVVMMQRGDPEVLYATGVGEHRKIPLADGSTVELNTDTELYVEFTSKQRHVNLSKGEAFFEVASDAGRPFIVTAGHGEIRAVGTGFTVRLKSANRVSVMVTEGAVEVTQSESVGAAAAPATAESPVLRSGQRAEYDRNVTRIEEVTPAELERTQAWRRGLLVFEDASVAEVVDEVNRYTETQLVLADPEIGKLRLGGTFKAGRIDALLFVLEKSFGIRTKQVGTERIELYSSPDDAAS